MLSPSESFINWDIATSLAFDFADASDLRIFKKGEESRKEFVQIYRDIINFIRPLISDYVEKPWPQKVDPVFVFDRAEWIVVNIENLKSLLLPLSQDYWEALESYLSLSYPLGGKIMKKASEISLTSELGLLIGYLSRKVLAQYDFGFPKTDGVIPNEFFYFVEPNILKLEQKFNLNPVNLRLWITLHEVTHSFQFKAFPWVGNYLNSLLQDYLKLIDDTIKTFKNEADEGVFVFSWGAGWWKNLLSSEHRELIRKIQALMCLIEGYSEHVMMHVGKRFPDYEEMVGIFKERQKRKTLAEQMLEKLIGFDLKVKQYALGEKFATHVADEEGIKVLNRAWECEENLPSWNEILMPDEWIRRIKSL
jgi:coenzyme F420 biosynthesis associated uncharacterized protein